MTRRARVERGKRVPKKPGDTHGDEPIPVVSARTRHVLAESNKLLSRIDNAVKGR